MITLKNVSKSYGKVTVLHDISLRIDPGEFVCIVGPSGAGKSTLLHLLTGAEPASKGHIEVDGVDLRDVPPPVMQLYRRRVGVVFQDYKLLKNRTVAENIAFPLEVCGIDDTAIAKRVKELIRQVGLAKHSGILPRALSGGEMARTAIARAIAASPMILLADEPTGNLDPEKSVEILALFKEIHRMGTTVVIATHDAGLVDTLHSRVIRLEDGKIIRDSIGGYNRKHHSVRDEGGVHGRHQIFTEAPHLQTQVHAPKEKKRVKVTGVN